MQGVACKPDAAAAHFVAMAIETCTSRDAIDRVRVIISVDAFWCHQLWLRLTFASIIWTIIFAAYLEKDTQSP